MAQLFRSRISAGVWATLLFLLWGTNRCEAQVDAAAITGTVTDASGATVAGASIEVTFAATNLVRSTETSDKGVYTVPNLPIGQASVRVSKAGFEGVTVANVVVNAAQVRTVDVRLSVSAVNAEVSVTASATALDQSSAAIDGVIEGSQVKNLPVNGRNWMSLMQLVPGAVNSGSGDGHSIRFVGHGADDNNFRLDGMDATAVRNQAQRTDIRLAISTDAIAEFRVDTALFTADKGGSAGGQAEVISKSGTNEFHGSAFEFLRNNFFDARSFVDGNSPPPFRLNQFGATLGAPIRKDSDWFFASYEGLRQRLGVTVLGSVPTAAYRSAILSQSPVLGSILAAFPEPNGAAKSSQVALWSGVSRADHNEDFGLIRWDHRFSENTTLYARFNTDQISFDSPLSDGTGSLGQTINTDAAATLGLIQLQHVFSPVLVNETKVGVNREPFHTQQVSPSPEAIKVAGLTTLQSATQRVANPTSYSVIDNASWSRGQHTLKSGIEIRRIQLNVHDYLDGTLTYTGLNTFQANQMDSLAVSGELPTKGLRKTSYFGYAQDEWKARPNLTLNLGVRYEFYNVFHEVNGRAIPFDFQSCGGYCARGASFAFPDTLNLDPRISVAWSPAASQGKTVVRLGYGRYHGDAQLGDQYGPANNDTSRWGLAATTTPGLSFPIDRFLTPLNGVANAPRALLRQRHDLYVDEWGFSVQHSVGAFVATAGYLGEKGTQMFLRTYTNTVNPVSGSRPLPALGLIDVRGTGGNSSFHNFMAGLRRSYTAGWTLSANYMWSHSIDDGAAGGGDADYPQNVLCRACERASSDYDVRHNFTGSSVYQLPFFRNGHGLISALLGGWQWSVIETSRTGLPLNVTVSRPASDLPDGNSTSPQRPDLITGVSLTPAGGSTANSWINIGAFAVPAKGAWGNLGRNIFRAPAFWQFDTALSKQFKLTERIAVSFRAEAFNIFNRAQYGAPVSSFSFDKNRAIVPATFGQILTPLNTGAVGTGTPRQMQLNARLDF